MESDIEKCQESESSSESSEDNYHYQHECFNDFETSTIQLSRPFQIDKLVVSAAAIILLVIQKKMSVAAYNSLMGVLMVSALVLTRFHS